jgi:hypothetical protein
MVEECESGQRRVDQNREGKVMRHEWEHEDGKCVEMMLLG